MEPPGRPTGAQGSPRAAELGVIAGYALKLIRGSVSLTQADLAERLGVDVSTVQGWESGRRPLSALKTGELIRLRNKLVLLGASPSTVSVLPEAIEADTILSFAVESGSDRIDASVHPLAAVVHRRSLVNLVTWPFTGIIPARLRNLPTMSSRGPVASAPVLDATSRDRFFDQMLSTAELGGRDSTPIMRRQASYLLGFDKRTASADWLARAHRAAMRRKVEDRDLPSGIAMRSASVALALHGDPEPLRYFINTTLSSESQSIANLTYWAYWIGEVTADFADDDFLCAAPTHGWAGTTLMAHLADHLDAPHHADLNIHSLWTLVLARPYLLDQLPSLRERVSRRVEKALSNGVTGAARDNLANLRCAVQLASR